MTYMGRPKKCGIPFEERDPTDTPTELFARIVELVWQCPQCGALWRSHQAPMASWKIKCEMCHNKWVIGVIFRRCLVGRKTPPPDTILAATEWRSGRRVNEVHPDEHQES